ncbi:MAG: DNA polymerase III subunit gamma/tau [Treponema sp.]|jgi:DNA polymerase-3 subunit gamma/tau|nr:DNA polymerase III subunit gamma/tau [Treponema sp.]
MADSTAPVYEVTATKRRPKTFDELAGQEFVVSTLKNSLQSGRIAHAYLFSGPRGCGKTSAARILARSLNCEKGPAQGPCGVCENCLSISRGTSMDVIEIDGASNTSVDGVRQIKDEVLFPPQAGRYKVYIIDEVHMLSNSAFNALLKTIEEPPPYIIFIFATTELHKVPATIKSRCQQFNFRLIPIETIQGILKKICGETGIEAEDEALFWIARESTGSLRDAFTLFDQVASFSGGSIRSGLIREKLGLVGLEKLNALAEACAANDTARAFALTDEILSSGVAIEQFVIDLAAYYRSLLLLKNGVERESLLGYSPRLFSAKALETFDGVRLEQALDLLLACYRDIRYSVSARFELETAISKLSWLSHWVSPPELKAAMEKAQSVLRSSSAFGGQVSHNRQDTPHTAAEETARPLAGGAGPPEAFEAAPAIPAKTGPDESRRFNADAGKRNDNAAGGGHSLSEDFRRMLASKSGSNAAFGGGEPEGGVHIDADEDEDDAPPWSGITHNSGAAPNEPETPPQVERLLRVIPGITVQ